MVLGYFEVFCNRTLLCCYILYVPISYRYHNRQHYNFLQYPKYRCHMDILSIVKGMAKEVCMSKIPLVKEMFFVKIAPLDLRRYHKCIVQE